MKYENIPIEQVNSIDRLIHEPARLSIMYMLSVHEAVGFKYLTNKTDVNAGTLSKHLGKLEDAGLVEIRKEFVLRKPKTWVSITEFGREALEEHWRQLNELREKSKKAKLPDQDET